MLEPVLLKSQLIQGKAKEEFMNLYPDQQLRRTTILEIGKNMRKITVNKSSILARKLSDFANNVRSELGMPT